MKSNKAFWDTYASDFDSIYGTKNSLLNCAINKLFRNAIKLRFEKTLAAIPEMDVSVLDIGCGPGHYCFTLAQSGNRDILGVDFSESMIQLAREHTRELGIDDKLDFQVTNILDFNPLKKFDYCIMMGFIEYFEDPALILRKVLSMTNRKIFISFPVDGGLLAFQRKLRYKKRCFLRMYSYSDIEVLMRQLSISDFTIEKISRDYFVTISMN